VSRYRVTGELPDHVIVRNVDASLTSVRDAQSRLMVCPAALVGSRRSERITPVQSY
jgi:hypothetical protein